jgi:hypothetical protein
MSEEMTVKVNVYTIKRFVCHHCGKSGHDTGGLNLLATEDQNTLLCPDCYDLVLEEGNGDATEKCVAEDSDATKTLKNGEEE